ncbi:MAG: tetratricopeptide repeat protein [Rhodopseudomonas palustris]|nr:tetratricopeptide repeat protein [Rhodopseudomonas palustris]
MGLIHNEFGERDEAVSCLTAAIEVAPDYFLLISCSERSVSSRMIFSRAEFFSMEAIRRELHPESFFFLGLLHRQSGNPKKAESFLMKAISEDTLVRGGLSLPRTGVYRA